VKRHDRPQQRWLERGQGEAVILLHGLMGDVVHWDEVLDRLAPSCRALAPALPIFDPAFTYTSVQALSAHVVGLMDTLGIERAVIGGNSLGGHVAIRLALAQPNRVSGLVLTGTSGLLEPSFSRRVSHRPGRELVRERMEEVFYDRRHVTPGWVDAVCRTLNDPALALRLVRMARAAKRDNVEARLPAIAVPALVVWGAHDRITPPSVAERLHALLPDSQLTFLPRCGHAPMLEHPAAWADIVAAWLARTRPRRYAGTAAAAR